MLSFLISSKPYLSQSSPYAKSVDLSIELFNRYFLGLSKKLLSYVSNDKHNFSNCLGELYVKTYNATFSLSCGLMLFNCLPSILGIKLSFFKFSKNNPNSPFNSISKYCINSGCLYVIMVNRLSSVPIKPFDNVSFNKS